VKLGPTEFRLLHFLMTHPERVHSRAQLLDRVWGDHVFIEERTVDVHIKRLREALQPVECAALIETVRGAGYRITQQIGAPRLSAARPVNWLLHGAIAAAALAHGAGLGACSAIGWFDAGGRWRPLGALPAGLGSPRGGRGQRGHGCWRWLRAGPARARVDGGLWGELAYRIERCARARAAGRGRAQRLRSSWRPSRPRPTACCCSTPTTDQWCNGWPPTTSA
jgi:hypothetical protein